MGKRRGKSRHGGPPAAANVGRGQVVPPRERPDYDGGWGLVFMHAVMLFCTGLLVVAVRGEFFDREMSRESQGWPSTEGEIVEARTEVVTRGRMHNRREIPIIRYVYRVENRRLAGSRVDFSGSEHFADRAAVMARYPVGARVSVWFRPEDPRVSTLERGGWNSPWTLAIDAAMAVLFAALPLQALWGWLLRVTKRTPPDRR